MRFIAGLRGHPRPCGRAPRHAAGLVAGAPPAPRRQPGRREEQAGRPPPLPAPLRARVRAAFSIVVFVVLPVSCFIGLSLGMFTMSTALSVCRLLPFRRFPFYRFGTAVTSKKHTRLCFAWVHTYILNMRIYIYIYI